MMIEEFFLVVCSVQVKVLMEMLVSLEELTLYDE